MKMLIEVKVKGLEHLENVLKKLNEIKKIHPNLKIIVRVDS